MSLNVELKSYHINEKLRRVHRVLAGEEIDTGIQDYDLNEPLFTIREGLAEFSKDTQDCHWLLMPTVHARVVELAMLKEEILSYKLQKERKPFISSLIINARLSGASTAPEYVHARYRVDEDGQITDLNDSPYILNIIEAGDYRAIHYIDYTGDGFIEAECPELALELPRNLAAYSMVSAVNFFPLVKQQELMQWWLQSVPPELEKNIWPSNPGPPLTLCDTRYPANLSLTLNKLSVENTPCPVFDPLDDTMSAVVGLLNSATGRVTRVDDFINYRISTLADRASGVFVTGGDTSIDRSDEQVEDNGTVLSGKYYFNNYGLGSPFPEDAMLCSALSSYWPAASFDITRTFAPGAYATATPLTDDLLGQTGEEP